MNIGINARFLHSEVLEGLGRYTWETTRNFVLNHPEHQYYLFFDRPFPEKYVFAKNITPIILGPQARHPFLFYIWFEFALPKALKKFNIDVLYSPDNFCSLKSKIPVVTVIHDLAYLHYPAHIPIAARFYYRYFMPKFIRRADHIITVSDYVKKDILSNFIINKEKISVAHNALPIRIEDENILNPIEEPYFLYVGSINTRKNLGAAIKAFSLFKKDNSKYKFVLIGRVSSLDADTASVLAHNIDNGNVIHLNNITDSELPNFYRSAKAFIYVSLFEGFGIPILEAMNYGTPVITSNVTSMPEVAGDAAILVDPNDHDDILKAMNLITQDRNLRQDLINKGKLRVQEFSWNKSSEIIYRQIISLKK